MVYICHYNLLMLDYTKKFNDKDSLNLFVDELQRQGSTYSVGCHGVKSFYVTDEKGNVLEPKPQEKM